MESQYPDSHPRSNPPHFDLQHFVCRLFEVHALHPDCCLYVLWDRLVTILKFQIPALVEIDLQPFRHHYRLSIVFLKASRAALNISAFCLEIAIPSYCLALNGLFEYSRVSTTVFVVEQCHFPFNTFFIVRFDGYPFNTPSQTIAPIAEIWVANPAGGISIIRPCFLTGPTPIGIAVKLEFGILPTLIRLIDEFIDALGCVPC